MTSTLFTADWLLPIATPPVREGGVVLDESGLVVDVGPAGGLAQIYKAARHVHVAGSIMPALVDAHAHVELAALLGRVPGGEGLVAWVTRLLGARAEVKDAERRDASEAAVEAMWARGVAAIGNVGNRLDEAKALARRPLQGNFFHEMLGSDERATGDAMAHGRRAYEQLVAAGDWPKRFRYVQAPHAPYSADADLLGRAFAAAARAGDATTVHIAEDADEIALLERGEGRWVDVLARMGVDPAARAPRLGPLRYLETLGAFMAPPPPLLVHMTYASAEDIALAARHRATVVVCARSNMHITGGLPPIERLCAAGLPLALGSDSLASNTTHSLWEEMATLANHFSAVPASVWLEAATLGGARGLGLPALGALIPGKRPGVIALEGFDGSVDDPARTLVRARPHEITWLATA